MKRPLLPVLHLPLFLVGGLAWVVVLGVVTALFFLADGIGTGVRPEELLTASALGGLTIAQSAGLAAWAGVLSLAVTDVPPWLSLQGAEIARRARSAFALRRSSAVMVGTALVGGLVVWTLPSWCADTLGHLFPERESTLALVNKALNSPDLLGRVLMSLAVGVSAPVFEELIFRGYVYRVLEIGFGTVAALVGSTLLFAAFHLDPIHVVSLLPTAAFLGFLRWRSGSLWPPLLAHAVNNALGVAGAQLFPDDPTSTLPLWVALVGFFAAIGVAVIGHRVAPEPASEPVRS